MECRSARLDGDEENAHKFWNLLDKPLREAICCMFTSNSDRDDLVQEAVGAIFKKIGCFEPERSSFVTWAKKQAYSAMTHYLRNTGYSRTIAEHKKIILEKLQFHFDDGPAPGESWLALAKEHQEAIAQLTGLSAKQVSNAMSKWSLTDLSSIEEVDKSPLHQIQSRFSWEDLQLAMSRLDQRSKTFLIQKHVSGLSYAEVAEKFNLTKSGSERSMTEANARQIVRLAIKKLRDTLDEMDPEDELHNNNKLKPEWGKEDEGLTADDETKPNEL